MSHTSSEVAETHLHSSFAERVVRYFIKDLSTAGGFLFEVLRLFTIGSLAVGKFVFDYLKEIPEVAENVSFLVPKVMIILLGAFLTPFSWYWFLLLLPFETKKVMPLLFMIILASLLWSLLVW